VNWHGATGIEVRKSLATNGVPWEITGFDPNAGDHTSAEAGRWEALCPGACREWTSSLSIIARGDRSLAVL